MDIGRGILLGTLNRIAGFFAELSNLFFNLGVWCLNIFQLYRLTPWFYDIGYFFGDLSWEVLVLRDSLLIMYDRTTEILDWSTIWSNILSRVPNLEEIGDFFADLPSAISNAIVTWWGTKVADILGWIDIAKQEALDLISSVEDSFSGLLAAWSYFQSSILPNLLMSWQIDDLIRSWFLDYEPFWAGWQEWRGDVVTFFSDPEQWVYDRLETFFERFW